jgi:hypothetical protein
MHILYMQVLKKFRWTPPGIQFPGDASNPPLNSLWYATSDPVIIFVSPSEPVRTCPNLSEPVRTCPHIHLFFPNHFI